MSFLEGYQEWKKKRESSGQKTESLEERYLRENAGKAQDAVTAGLSEWLKNSNTFIQNYNSRLNNAQEGVYRSDSQAWLDRISGEKERFDTAAGQIKDILTKYQNYLDPEWCTNVTILLDENRVKQSQIVKYASADNDYWLSWSGEEEYNKAYDNATYGEKYAESTYKDIQKALGSASGREKDWLSSHADSYMSSQDAQAEIDRLNSEKKKPFLGGIFNVYSYEEMQDDEAREARIKELEAIRDTAKRNEKAAQYDQFRALNGFSYSAEQGAAMANPSAEEILNYEDAMTRAEGTSASAGIEPVSIKNKLAYYYENPLNIDPYLADGNATYSRYKEIITEGMQRNWDALNDDEIQMYNYLLYQQGEEAADRYLDDIQVIVDKRVTDEETKNLQKLITETEGFKGGLLNVGLSLASIPVSVFGVATSFLDNTAHQLKGESINPYSNAQTFRNFVNTVRGEVGAEVADTVTWNLYGRNVMEGVYNAVMSMGDSVVGASTLGSMYLWTMGSGAAANKSAEVYENGGSDSQILWSGIAAGAAEILTEKVSLDNLIKEKDAATIGGWLREVMKQSGIEASEEVASEIINTVTDGIIMANKSDLSEAIKKYEEGYYDNNGIYHESVSHEEAVKQAYADKVADAVQSGIEGALSGGLSSSVVTGVNTVKNANALAGRGQAILDHDGGYEVLRNLANEVTSENLHGITSKNLEKSMKNINNLKSKTESGVKAIAEKTASKGQTKRTAKNVAKLSDMVYSTHTEQNLTEIENTLVKKGLTNSEAKVASKILNEALSNEELTEDDLQVVKENTAVRETLRSLIRNPESTVNKRNERFLNILLGNKTAESHIDGNTAEAGEKGSVSEGKNLSMVENASEREYEVSVEGKTIDNTTGSTVTIKDIVSTEDGNMMLEVETEDGAKETVSAKNLSYASQSEAVLYEAVANMGVTPDIAQSLVDGYHAESGISAENYILGADEAFRYGQYNLPIQELSGVEHPAYELSEAQLDRAYKLGQIVAGRDVSKTVSKLKEAIANSKGKKGEGKVHYEGDAVSINEDNLNDRQKTGLKTMEMLSKALGVDFYVYSSYVNEKGVRVYKTATGEIKSAPNGWYDRQTGAIHIDLNAGNLGEGTMLFTVAHELTHFIKAWSPAKFKVLANFLAEQYGKKGVSVDKLVRNQMANMKANGRKNVTYDLAFEEFVADSMETMLRSGNVMESLAEIKRRDEGLWNKIKEFFSNLVDLLKKTVKAYSGVAPDTVEGQTVATMKYAIEQFEKLFTEGLVDASENFRAISSAEQHGNFKGADTTSIQLSARKSYPYSMATVIQDYLNGIDTDILKYAEECRADKNTDYKRLRIGDVSKRQAADAKRLLKIDFTGYQNAIERSAINHIEKRHGEQGLADKSMKDLNDVSRVGYILENYDTVEITTDADGNENFSKQFRDKDNNPAPMLKYSKKINGTYYAVIACPDAKYKKLWLVSAYIGQKNSSKVTQESDDKSPDSTPKARLASPSTAEDIITHPSDSVNTSDENPHSDRKIVDIPNNKYVEMYHHFGSTKNYDVAGYILGNGVMLDFSGKHWGDDYSTSRQVDHRDIQEVLDDRGNNGVNAMIDMIGNGNIRLMPEVGGINLAVKPNETQMSVLRGYINHFKGEVVIDIDKVGGDTINSFSYTRGTSSSKILSDLKTYFDEGIVPEQKVSDETDIHQFLYSDRDYSYEALSSKPDMTLTPVDDSVKRSRADIVYYALQNAVSVGHSNQNGNAVVYVDDIATEVIVPKRSLVHGLDRRANTQAPVLVKIGEVLKNSIRINELNPRADEVSNSYVLVGAAVSQDGTPYIASFVVNKYSNEVSEIDVLYSANAKKESAAFLPKITENSATPTNSKVSIARLLDFVNNNFPDILPESVLRHFGHTERPEGKIGESALFSDRNKDSVSNRSLLANALESTAKEGKERNLLRNYKTNIRLIEAEQAKLDEVRKQAQELRFNKGRTSAETKKLRDLDFEAGQISARINSYDRQLLDLEVNSPLKDVLDREKKMAYKRAEQKGEELLREYREKAVATQKEIVKRYQESRREAVEGRRKTEMRHKIKGIVSELNQLLLRGSKDKHVMIELQKAVASALDAVNMDTVGAEERAAKYNALIAKSNDPDVIQSLTETRDRILAQGERMGEKLVKLKNAYSDIKNADDPMTANSYDDVIFSKIESVVSSVGNTPLRDMTMTQLEDVYDLYRMVLTTIRNANKAFKAKKGEEISVLGNRVMEEIERVGGKRLYTRQDLAWIEQFGWNNLKPVYAFKAIGSKTLSDMFDNVREGEDTWARDVTEAKAFKEEVTKKYQYTSWDFKKQYTFRSKAGATFSLNLDQIMSLYAYSKRKQADKHLEMGGFVFDSAIEVTKKNKIGVPIKYNVNTATAHNLSKDTLDEIISNLSADQKNFVDEMQEYLSTVMGEKGNEVSLAMYGVKLFKEKFYFPLKSAKQFMFEQNEVAGEVKIKNAGFSKETVDHANNPIILSNFMDVWANHVNDMSMYHAFVLPLEDFNRVFNYKTQTSDKMPTNSVKMFLQNAYGKSPGDYIKQLLTDLNGGARVDSQAGIINKALGGFKKASVFASLSVVVQQPSAIGRAFAYVDPKYFVGKKLDEHKHKALWDEVKTYAPVAIIKEMGYFDVGNGRSTVDFIKDEKTFMNRVDDVASWLPAKADEITWCAIWEAVKRETAAKNKDVRVDSEAFLEAAGKRFTEVIVNTQVYDSVLSRSAMMRSKDTGVKMATAFMAEPTTTMNMMVDAHFQSKRGYKKFARQIRGGVVASILINSILVSFIYAARDDDDDETYTEKYLGALASELFDGFNPLTYIPFVKDIWSIMQGYDVERSDMSLYSKLWESVEGLFKTNTSAYDKVKNFTGTVASLFGLPVNNVWRDVEALFNVGKDVASGTPTTGAGIGNSVMDSIRNAVPLLGRFTSAPSNGQQLYDAILSGDEKQIERVKARFKDDQAIETALRKALRENDSRIAEAAQARLDGNVDEYVRIAKEIIAEGHFSQDLVVAAVNNEMTAIEKAAKEQSGTEEETEVDKATSFYSTDDINSALENGDTDLAKEIIDDLIRTKVENGMEESNAKSSVKSSVTSYWKPIVKAAEGNTSELYRIRELLWKTGLYGKTYSEVYSTMRKWMDE